MKKLTSVFLLFLIVNRLTAQVLDDDNGPGAHIAAIERQAHKRLKDALGTLTADSFSVASENFDIHHYRCEWQIDPSQKFIRGKVTVSFLVKISSGSIVLDLANQLGVDSILYHGNAIAFQRLPKDGLQVQFAQILSAGTKDSVSMYYKGIPDPTNTGAFFQGFYSGIPSVWTLSEPYGSKQWWPCKNGLTDKADSIDIIITCPADYVPSSNGVVAGEFFSGTQRVTHFKHRYPIASYLVAIAVSKYRTEKDSVQIGNRQMPVLSYVYALPTPNDFKTATNVAKLCLYKFSDLFGLYPFYKEHYCQTQWGVGGGMEHQTNSFIGNQSADLVSHELGHQWFGDKATCGSWQDLWLNEGFATYTTNIYYEHVDTALMRNNLQKLIISITSQPGGSVWVNDTTNSARLFSSRLTYNKGAYVVHMLRWVLGDSIFFKGVRRYLDDAALAYSFARTSDLRRVLEAESGKRLDTFFQKWVYGEGYPDYHAEWTQNSNNWIKLKLNQTTSHSSVSFYEMPVMIVAKSGSREATFVVDHRYTGQEFSLNAGFPVDTILIDPKLWLLSKKKTSAKTSESPLSNYIKVYPNPAPGELRISLINPTDKRLSIKLLNMLGQSVYRKEIQTSGSNELIIINLNGLTQGIYCLALESEKNIRYVRQIVHTE